MLCNGFDSHSIVMTTLFCIREATLGTSMPICVLNHWPTDVQFLPRLTAANWSGCNMTLQTLTDIKASLIYQTLDTIPDTTFVSLPDGIWRFITRGEERRGKVQKRKINMILWGMNNDLNTDLTATDQCLDIIHHLQGSITWGILENVPTFF